MTLSKSGHDLRRNKWSHFLGLGVLTLVFCVFCAMFPQSGATRVDSPPSLPQQMQISSLKEPSDLFKTGMAQYEAGQFAAAIDLWRQALDRYSHRRDRLNQAVVSSNLALAYQQLGQLPEANQAIANSLNLLQSPSQQGEQQQQHLLAQALNIQGALQLTQGQAESALSTWEQATQIYQKVGDQTGIVQSLINQSQALRALGLYPRARATLQPVEAILKTQLDPQLQAAGLLNLGNSLRLLGQMQPAQQVLQHSLELAQQTNSSELKTAALMSLGNTARSRAAMVGFRNRDRIQQEFAKALQYYQQAAETGTTAIARTQALLNQQSLLLEQGNIAAVQSLLEQIRPHLAKLPVRQATVHAHLNLAHTLLRLSKQTGAQPSARSVAPTEIAALLTTAIRQARQLGDVRAETYALGYFGELYEQRTQWVEAQQLTEQALALAERNNAADMTYRWQGQLGRLLQAQWEASGRQSHRLRDGAIAAYTQAVNSLSSIRNDLVSSHQDVQFSFRESVEPIYRELVGLLLSDAGTPNQANMKKARGVIESLQIAELDNFFREACLSGKPTEIDKIDQTAAVIYPIILRDRLEVVVSLPNQTLHHYPTRMSQQELEGLFAKMRRSLRRTSLEQERLAIAQTLYDLLIRRAEPILEANQIKTLAFVLDGSLKNIPMAALYDGQQYLLEKYKVAVTPGLQLLSPRSLQPQNLRVLLGGLSEARDEFSALPAVKEEVAQIQTEVPLSEVLLNDAFTSERFQQKVKALPFPIVHLATHGLFSSNAEDTFILAWDRRINVRQLGELLQNREAVSQAPIELLVLSACQTASGDNRAALGLAGVAVKSGARSTLASLWSVDDASTSQFMVQFYQALTQPGTSKAEALRQAQIALLQQFPHPYHWAPFILVGNWL